MSQLFRDEHPLLMYCRRLNLPAVKILVWYFMPLVSYHLKPLWQQQVRGGHAPDVVDSEGKGALWYATLPNRRGLGRNLGFNVLVRHFNRILQNLQNCSPKVLLSHKVRRVRGDLEPQLRGDLVKLLVNAGVRVNQGVLDNLTTSLPSLRYTTASASKN